MKGKVLAALYSFGCKRTDALGVNSILERCVRSNKSNLKLISILRKLEPYPFYALIARSNGLLSPFDLQVVQAYWLGNELLDKVKPESVTKLTKYDFCDIEDKELLFKIAFLLTKIKLGQGLPFHNWIVLYPQIEAPHNEDLDYCRISWGKITKVNGSRLTVEAPIIKFQKKIYLAEPKEKEIDIGFVQNPQVGQWVSIHLNQARQILDPKNLANLEKYTQKTLDLLNKLKRK